MMRILSLLVVLVLAGCARTPDVSETIAQNAINATTALEQGISEECKTDGIKAQILLVKREIRTAIRACQTEKDKITQEKLRWKWAFWGLVVVITAYIARKVLK